MKLFKLGGVTPRIKFALLVLVFSYSSIAFSAEKTYGNVVITKSTTSIVKL